MAQTGNTKELQSAYHEDHSMETALLKVKMDLLAALFSQMFSVCYCNNFITGYNIGHKYTM